VVRDRRASPNRGVGDHLSLGAARRHRLAHQGLLDLREHVGLSAGSGEQVQLAGVELQPIPRDLAVMERHNASPDASRPLAGRCTLALIPAPAGTYGARNYRQRPVTEAIVAARQGTTPALLSVKRTRGSQAIGRLYARRHRNAVRLAMDLGSEAGLGRPPLEGAACSPWAVWVPHQLIPISCSRRAISFANPARSKTGRTASISSSPAVP